MSWFSDETRIYVATSITRIIKDELILESGKAALTNSLLKSEDIPSNLVEATLHSLGSNVGRAYAYAQTHYSYGLPSGQYISSNYGADEVRNILSVIEGVTVSIVASRFGPANIWHMLWMQLIALQGYDPDTNILTSLYSPTEGDAYLTGFIITVPAALVSAGIPDSLYCFGISDTAGYTPTRAADIDRDPTGLFDDALASVISVEAVYEYPTSVVSAVSVPLPSYDDMADYFHAVYSVGGVTKYWMYKQGLGTYSTLDNLFSTSPGEHGTFLPFVYFRFNSAAEGTDTGTEEYRTSKRLSKYFGLDYASLCASVNSDDNPGIGDVYQAALLFAVPAVTTNVLEQMYLFDFFFALFHRDPFQFDSEESYQSMRLIDRVSSTRNTLVIQDTRLNMHIGYENIYLTDIVGTIGEVGFFNSSQSDITREILLYEGETGPVYTYGVIKVNHYRCQISETTYREISVVGLYTAFDIYANNYSLGTSDDPTLVIPLDYSIVNTYSLKDQEILYARGMSIVFNSVTFVVLEWYERAWFSTVIQIAAFVIMVCTGVDASVLLEKLVEAVATQSVTLIVAALIPIIKAILANIIVYYGITAFVKLVGPEAAAVLAIIAIAAGVFESAGNAVPGSLWAEMLLELGSGISRGIQTEVKRLYGELLEEYTTLNVLKDKETKELEAANKLLEHRNWLNPFVIFGEKPEDYYNRTVHSGNIGTISLSAISHYVDNALKLPKFNNTIEGYSYG